MLSLGAAWVASIGAGPAVQPADFNDDRPPAMRVEYRMSNQVLQTPVVDMPAGGTIDLPDLEVPFANVSKVRINLIAVTDDPAVGDTFDVYVQAPDEEVRQGSLASPQVSPGGYQISNTVVEEWARTAVPPRENYRTRSEATALHWAAENHTDSASVGPWAMTVDLQPPPGNLRNVNVTLTFTFTVYEAFAFQPVPEGAASDANESTTSEPGTDAGTTTPTTLARPHQNPLQTDARGAKR